jgi:hypothetical protein
MNPHKRPAVMNGTSGSLMVRVLVIGLPLDLLAFSSSFSFSICSGINRSARVTRAARFGRSLSLPS